MNDILVIKHGLYLIANLAVSLLNVSTHLLPLFQVLFCLQSAVFDKFLVALPLVLFNLCHTVIGLEKLYPFLPQQELEFRNHLHGVSSFGFVRKMVQTPLGQKCIKALRG